MPGLGVPELLLIVVIVVALFGPAVIAFLLGYFVGSSRAKQAPPEVPVPAESASAHVAPNATGPASPQPQPPESAPAPPASDALKEPTADE